MNKQLYLPGLKNITSEHIFYAALNLDSSFFGTYPPKKSKIPYQMACLYAMVNCPNILLAADMGLGKTWITAQTLRIKKLKGELSGTILFVSPNSKNMPNIVNDFNRFAPELSTAILHPEFGWKLGDHKGVDILITHYKYVAQKTFLSLFLTNPPSKFTSKNPSANQRLINLIVSAANSFVKLYNIKGLVLDEAHKVKDVKTVSYKFFQTIARTTQISYCLSGTPSSKRYEDLWAVAEVASGNKPNPLGTLDTYLKEYFSQYIPKNLPYKKIIYNFKTARFQEVMDKLSSLKIAYAADEVGLELPEMVNIIEHYVLEGGPYETFMALWQENHSSIARELNSESEKKSPIYHRLKALMCGIDFIPGDLEDKRKYLRYEVQSKLDRTLITIKKILEDHNTNKIVIFFQYSESADSLTAKLNKEGLGSLLIDGRVTIKKQLKNLNEFNIDPLQRILLLNYASGDAGLNLQIASHILKLDLAPSEVMDLQADNRVRRIGQLRLKVYCHSFVASNVEFEAKIYEKLKAGRKKVRRIVEHKYEH